jgi:hypothetical protein
MKFISSKKPTDLLLNLPLTHIRADPNEGTFFIPILDNSIKSNICFKQWWNEIVYGPNPDYSLSRREIIFFMRSQHGGAHVDDNLRNKGYHGLVTRGLPEVEFSYNQSGICLHTRGSKLYCVREDPGPNAMSPGSPDDPRLPVKNGHLATVRQIAWELDESLKAVGY